MAIKPLPKALLIVLVVGAVGFGLTKALPSFTKKAEPQVVEIKQEAPLAITLKTPEQVEQQAQRDAEQAVQAAKAAVPGASEAPSGTSNGGLDALMQKGKK